MYVPGVVQLLSLESLCLCIHFHVSFCPLIQLLGFIVLMTQDVLSMPIHWCSVNHIPDACDQIKMSRAWAQILVFGKTLG